MFRPVGLLMSILACAAPVAAVAVLRSEAPAGLSQQPAQPPVGHEGLRSQLARIDIHPGILSDQFVCRFPIGNGGQIPVAILSAKTSCGCASLRFEPSTIQPGAWGEAIVTVAGRGRFGIVDAAIEAQTDDGRAPLTFAARVHLPPQPRLVSDEIIIPVGQTEVEVPLLGGDARFALQVLATPTLSNPAFAAQVVHKADGSLAVRCSAPSTRPAAARLSLRVGYDQTYAVDLAVRVLAE